MYIFNGYINPLNPHESYEVNIILISLFKNEDIEA